MKRTLILLTIIIFTSLQSSGQETRDALYLKNGSIIYGKLIEVKDGQYKIKTDDKILFVYPSEDISKIIIGEQSESKAVRINDPNGPGFGLEFGFLLGGGGDHFPLLYSFNPMFTYTFATRQTLCFVTGMEVFDQITMPLSVEYRYNILKRGFSPLLYIRGSGLIGIGGEDNNDEYKGGWSAGIGTGFRWPIGMYESFFKFGFRYGLTVRKETRDYYYGEYLPAEYTYHSNFYRIEIKWGFKF